MAMYPFEDHLILMVEDCFGSNKEENVEGECIMLSKYVLETQAVKDRESLEMMSPG